MPPRAVPSSFVRTMPVTPATSPKTRAWLRPFCPVVASSTRSTSDSGASLVMTRRILPSSSMRPCLFCRRPAVSTSTTSAPSVRPRRTASNATAAGSAPSRSDRTVGTPTREPQVSSWSAAAARNVSAAPSTTLRSSATSTRASLPTVVVLPVPFTPTTSTTAGTVDPSSAVRGDVASERSSVGSTSATSSVRRRSRTLAASRTPRTRTLVRSASMSSPAGPAPTSARRRVSSSSSQSSSVRWSRERTDSRRAPSGDPERARRSRSRTSRPPTGSGRSSAGGAATSGSGGASTVAVPGGASTASGAVAGGAAGAVGGGSTRSRRPRRRTDTVPAVTRPTTRRTPRTIQSGRRSFTPEVSQTDAVLTPREDAPPGAAGARARARGAGRR